MDLGWSVPDFWDVWKAMSVGLTGLFGIMGLLTTYKDKDTGQFTIWGKINFAGIVLSATMGVLSQLVDSQHKIDSARQSAKEAAASAEIARNTATGAKQAADNTEKLIAELLRVSQETRRIATGTRQSVANSRSAALAGQIAASRTLVVARGTSEAVSASKAGLSRIERVLSPFNKPTVIIRAHLDQATDTDECPYKDIPFGTITTIFDKQITQGVVYDGKGSTDCKFYMEFELHAQGNYGITSYLDLPGKTLEMQILFDKLTVKDEKRLVLIDDIIIRTEDAQSLSVPMDKVKTSLSGEGESAWWTLDYTFPDKQDPRTGSN